MVKGPRKAKRTLRFVKVPGCGGSSVRWFRLMSRISSFGRAVSYIGTRVSVKYFDKLAVFGYRPQPETR